MLPITGPLTSTVSLKAGAIPPATYWGYRSKTWYRQKRPYDRPLAYSSLSAFVTGFRTYNPSIVYRNYFQTGAYLATSRSPGEIWLDPTVAAAYNKAYARLVAKLKSDTAELGTALAEYRKTATMVEDRVAQLYRFVRAVKRLRFDEANKLLRIPSGFRPKARSFGGAVLEYSFGWAPTVNDIYSGMKVLTGGVPPTFASAKAQDNRVPGTYYKVSSVGSGSCDWRQYTLYSARCTVGAGIIITNPNLWLANQLGFINPASVLWELAAWSFVVDYFGNIGQVLNSWSEWFGAELLRPHRSFVLEVSSDEYWESGKHYLTGALLSSNVLGHAARMERDLSLPGPSLRFRPQRVSLRRATTSVALLLQQLKGK